MRGSELCGYCKAPDTGSAQYETRDLFGNSYIVKRCSACGAYFLSPRPSEEDLSRAYSDSYYGAGESKFVGLFEVVLDLFRKGRADFVARYVPEGGNMLDVGCGNGRLLKHVCDLRRCHAYGIEIPGKSAQRALRIPQITVKIGELAPADYPDGFFDVVTLFHVFEHVGEPTTLLHTVSAILKDGGVCIMSFPNIASIQAGLFKGNWLHLDPPRHLFFLAPDDFVRQVSSFGLVAQKTSYFSAEQNPFGWIQSILNGLTRKRDVLLELLKGNTELTSGIPWPAVVLQAVFFILTFPFFVLIDIFEAILHRGATVQFVLRKVTAPEA